MLTRICFIMALPLLAGQTAPTWRPFAPKDAGFKVEMPGATMEKKQRIKIEAGVADLSLFICEAPAELFDPQKKFADKTKEIGDVTFVVGVTKYPEGGVEGGLDQRLRNARDAAVKNAEGKLYHHRKITLAGHPGLELWIDTKDNGLIHTRLYTVKQRLYQTMAIGPKKRIETPETDRFLNSFKLQ